MMTRTRPPVVFALALWLGLAAAGFAWAQQKTDRDAAKAQEGKRPKINVRAQPSVGVAPARVVLTGELQGGADDFEEYYCPSIEWEWGDDTSSESTLDCEPYEAGKTQIKRRYTVQHTFRHEGSYKVYFHLKRKDKLLGSGSVTVQVQPGAQGPDWRP
jgi:hypothetical protein